MAKWKKSCLTCTDILVRSNKLTEEEIAISDAVAKTLTHKDVLAKVMLGLDLTNPTSRLFIPANQLAYKSTEAPLTDPLYVQQAKFITEKSDHMIPIPSKYWIEDKDKFSEIVKEKMNKLV
ncbi:hypothetical protein FGO68_gene4928 [Halteria grandinella]|uniref:Uncharacterized protein n=1 Tax=Halteria grandinella TaxID=5974 RepID=A0A8J8T653_HALGN|nr:hypothetical protein FGO68_gene4928 [Halteria grandinella]